MQTPKKLSDNDLHNQICALRNKERETIYQLLLHLVELDRRKLYLEHAHSSLFAYCTAELGYSEAAAQRRIVAARCMAQHPEIGEKIQSGELSLSNVSAAAALLTTDNKEEILGKVSGVSRREAEKRLAKYRPAKRRVAERIVAMRLKAAEPAGPNLFDRPPASEKEGEKECFRLSVTVSTQCMEKLERARSLLSNKAATRTLDGLIEHLLDDYLKRNSPEAKQRRREKRRAKNSPKQASIKASKARAIPAATRDDVFVRDQGRCCFVAANGKRCNSRHALQIDHVQPFARGGEHSPENLRLLCAAHNQHAADKVFGREWMDVCRTGIPSE